MLLGDRAFESFLSNRHLILTNNCLAEMLTMGSLVPDMNLRLVNEIIHIAIC